MKKMVLSLVTLMVLGTSTGFCSTKVNNNGSKPRTEQVTVNRGSTGKGTTGNGTYNMQPGSTKKVTTDCNCKECQKMKKNMKKQPKPCTCKNCQKHNVTVQNTTNHGQVRK